MSPDDTLTNMNTLTCKQNSILPLCLTALMGWSVSAQEIGYVETFGLAGDREAALKELVPGTDDYFYYHTLQAQNTSQRERFQEVMDRWIRERNGQVTDGARELLNRQALLDYEKNPQKTLKYLREQMDLHFDHARKTGERRSDAPTRFDNALISADVLLKSALAEEPRNLERIENAGLELAAGQPITDDQRRNLLARLQRPDYPGLVDLILADLKYRDSRGFASLEIHKRLTLAQMDELLRKDPGLRNQVAFRDTYLARLAPESEVDLQTDPAALEAYLDRLWTFVQTLDPVHNSLKAHVLYHRLRYDQKHGVYSHDRFLEYVKLPRNVPYLADQIRQQLPRGDYMAQLDQAFGLAYCPPDRQRGAARPRVFAELPPRGRKLRRIPPLDPRRLPQTPVRRVEDRQRHRRPSAVGAAALPGRVSAPQGARGHRLCP